jgi:hypothetical protein
MVGAKFIKAFDAYQFKPRVGKHMIERPAKKNGVGIKRVVRLATGAHIFQAAVPAK